MPTAREIVEKTIAEWQSENTVDKVAAHAKRLLDKRRDDLILMLVGLERHWARGWEVDHCNGRHSAIDKALRNTALTVVEEWIDENIQDLPKMGKDLVEACLEEYKALYRSLLASELRRIAQERATADARRFVNEFVSSYGDTVELLADDTDDTDDGWE